MFDYDGATETTPDPLTPADVLAKVTAGVRRRRLAEVEELQWAMAWADLHGDDSASDLTALGGDGTPAVRDGCLGEFALARDTGAMAAVNAISDGLDLRHRLPRMWARTQSGEVDVWIPRRVAKLSRHLPLAAVHVVDVAVAPLLGHESAGRILEVAEAKVIEADPELHQRRVEAARKGRHVRSTRSDDHGLRTLVARIDAGDAVWVEATVARVAQVLAPRHQDLSADEVRAVAFGHLARPGELLALLLEHVAVAAHLTTAGYR